MTLRWFGHTFPSSALIVLWAKLPYFCYQKMNFGFEKVIQMVCLIEEFFYGLLQLYSLWGSSFSKYARDGADASWKGYREGVKLIFAFSVTFR